MSAETKFWEIENGLKCLWIIIGKRKIKYELFESISDNMKDNFLIKTFIGDEIQVRREICNQLINYAKRVRAGVKVDVKDMTKQLEDYEAKYRNILLKDEDLNKIREGIKQMQGMMSKSQKTLYLGELKELRYLITF